MDGRKKGGATVGELKVGRGDGEYNNYYMHGEGEEEKGGYCPNKEGGETKEN